MLIQKMLTFSTIAFLNLSCLLRASDCPWTLSAGPTCEQAHGPWVPELECNCKPANLPGGSPKICDRLIAFVRSPEPSYSNWHGTVAVNSGPDGGTHHDVLQMDYACGTNFICSQGSCLRNPVTDEYVCPVVETQELTIDVDAVFDSCDL